MRTLIGSIKPEDQHIPFGSKTLPQVTLRDYGVNVGIDFNRFTYHGMFEFIHIYYIGSYEKKVKR
jgi:hypothetical protein